MYRLSKTYVVDYFFKSTVDHHDALNHRVVLCKYIGSNRIPEKFWEISKFHSFMLQNCMVHLTFTSSSCNSDKVYA